MPLFLSSILDILHQFWWILYPLELLVAVVYATIRDDSRWSGGAATLSLMALFVAIVLGFIAMLIERGYDVSPALRDLLAGGYVYGFFYRLHPDLSLLDTICNFFGWFVVLAAFIPAVAVWVWVENWLDSNTQPRMRRNRM